MPQQKLDLLKLTARTAWHSLAHVRQSWGDSLAMPALAAERFTTCQITFTVMPLPKTLPVLVTKRRLLLR